MAFHYLSPEEAISRRGLRMVDLLRPERLTVKVEEAREHYQQLCRGMDAKAEVDFAKLRGLLEESRQREPAGVGTQANAAVPGGSAEPLL